MKKERNKRISLLLASALLMCVPAGCKDADSGTAATEEAAADNTEEAAVDDTSANDEVSDAAAAENVSDENQQESTDENQETSGDGDDTQSGSEDTDNTEGEAQTSASGAPEIAGLTYESEMELTYAECFHVYYYNDGYKLLSVPESGDYLIVPEGKEAPENLDESYKILQQPLDTIYLAATSSMALFDSMDALDHIRFSSVQASSWYIENAVKAMEAGDIVFAGKYSEPDYELLLEEGCDLAIESTMILHTPKVQEMIEMLDIPVFMDRSSYENHPLGRTEWIKAYAAMLNKEAEAEAFFADQSKIIEELKDFENTGKTVAIFYINSSGIAIVRSPSDYMAKMVEIAGGKYAFSDVLGDSSGTTVNMTMEEFYASAVDADYLIYNGSIDNSVSDMDSLMAKSDLFADFKSVKEGNVWTTGKSLYQETNIVGELIRDVNLMLTGNDGEDMTFLTRLK